MAGGDVLQISSTLSLSEPLGGSLIAPGTHTWLLPALLAAEWQIPLLWSALGVPATIGPDVAPLVQIASDLTAYRTVRDQYALERLREAGVTGPVDVVPDPQVLLAEDHLPEALRATWDKLVKAGPSREMPTLCVHLGKTGLASEGHELCDALQTLVRRHFGRVILYADTASSQMRQKLHELSTQLAPAAVLLEKAPGFEERQALAWGADAVLCGNFQDCLMALAFHKPHVVLGDEPCFRGYAASLGRNELVVPRAAMLPAALQQLMPNQSSYLAEQQRQIWAEARRHFDQMAAILNKQSSLSVKSQKKVWAGDGLQLNHCRHLRETLAACSARRWCRAATDQHKDRIRTEAQLEESRHNLENVRRYYSRFRFRLVEGLYERAKHWPLAGWLCFKMVERVTPVVGWLLRFRQRRFSLAKLMDRLLYLDPPLTGLSRIDLAQALEQYFAGEIAEFKLGFQRQDPVQWFQRYRPTPALLDKLRKRSWPQFAPRFSIVLRLNRSSCAWLVDTLNSVTAQTYPHWQLVVVLQAEPVDSSLHDVIQKTFAKSPERLVLSSESSFQDDLEGDYVTFLNHGDALEPQALHRFAETILTEHADLLYGDAVNCGDHLDQIQAVSTRPAFSYDFYLAHDYFGEHVALRRELFCPAGRFAHESEGLSPAAWILRALEAEPRVSHIPDILHRIRRGVGFSSGNADVFDRHRNLVRGHLERLGIEASIDSTDHPACASIGWPLERAFRTAIIIPTKDRQDLLSRCVKSLEETVAGDRMHLCILDHESKEAATHTYLQDLAGRHQVVRYQGPFNYSMLNNHAVSKLKGEYDFYLFLNNDVEALTPGWLEHMVGIGQRQEVGAVGSLLLYPDRTVQHAGCAVGLHFGADHIQKHEPAFAAGGRRQSGKDMAYLACRDQSILTGACLLVRADVFREVGGFDSRYEVGFGDADLCLRIRARGYKVILDTQAMLIHHESVTRGKSLDRDPHRPDTYRFQVQYLSLIMEGDPHHSPLLSRQFDTELNPFAVAKEHVRARTVQVVPPALPRASEQANPLRRVA